MATSQQTKNKKENRNKSEKKEKKSSLEVVILVDEKGNGVSSIKNKPKNLKRLTRHWMTKKMIMSYVQS